LKGWKLGVTVAIRYSVIILMEPDYATIAEAAMTGWFSLSGSRVWVLLHPSVALSVMIIF